MMSYALAAAPFYRSDDHDGGFVSLRRIILISATSTIIHQFVVNLKEPGNSPRLNS